MLHLQHKFYSMKKPFFTLLMGLCVMAALAGNIEKTYYFDSPIISQFGEYQIVKFENTLLTGQSGQPSLPYLAVSLLLPPGEKATGIELVCEDQQIIDGFYSLYPYQPSRPLSEGRPSVFQKNEAVYQSNTIYPASMTGPLSTAYLNGHSFGFSSFSPVSYLPAEGKLSYYRKVTVRITTSVSGESETALQNFSQSAWIKEKVNRLAQNPELATAYKALASRSLPGYEFLIVTPNAYAENYGALIETYLHRGIRTQVVTKELIAETMTGTDLQEKIRNFILQEYQSNGVECVLLGGDVELIPYRGFYAYVVSGSGYEDYGIPADLYYSALDGNWNTDNDNKWGEPDEDDLLPDIAVGRFPFSNADELASMIHKSIYYQDYPVLGEFTSPLLAGEFLYDPPETWGSDYLDLLIGQRDDNGYTTFGIPEDYSIQTMYEEDGSWSGSDLINAINQGKQFVHHVGHASQTYVAYLSNSDITNSNFAGANGEDHNFTFLQTHGCDCGAFDYGDCILERMVTINNFAVAVMGNSRYGWFNEGQTEGPAAHLHREMVDAQFHEKIQFLGKAFAESKIQTAPWVEAAGQWEEGALRWNFYDLNILGDPALSVYTAEPVAIEVGYLSELPVGTVNTNVHVSSNGEGLANFTCSVLLNGELLALGLTNVNGDVNLSFDPPVVEVCTATLQVVGYNCLPHAYAINFIPDAGPYVVYDSSIVNDAAANGNGQVDAGEAILLGVVVKNVGAETGFNVVATLSSDDDYIGITDNTAEVTEIPAGETQTLTDAFRFDVAANIPDQHSIQFTLSCTNGDQTWLSYFTLTAHGPHLTMSDFSIDDTAGGNGNGLLDPGEELMIYVSCTNDGSADAVGVTSRLTEENPFVSIDQNLVELGALAAGETKIAAYDVSVLAETPIGTLAQFVLRLAGEGCVTEEVIYQTIGLLFEDFESGTFNSFEWNSDGAIAWTISDVNPFEGEYSARSGSVSDEEVSGLWISMEMVGEGTISFESMVSSESGYDYLRFYIDDVMKEEWSGEADWALHSYSASQGSHVFRWAYEKDYSVSNGSDAAWIDQVIFPVTATLISVGETRLGSGIKVYPVPAKDILHIDLGISSQSTQIRVLNHQGICVHQVNTDQRLLDLDLSGLADGMYLLETISNGQTNYRKIILQ